LNYARRRTKRRFLTPSPISRKRRLVAPVSKPAVSPTSKSQGIGNHSVAGLETRDTADLEVCATVTASNAP